MKHFAIAALAAFLLLAGQASRADDAFAACAEHLPFGTPTVQPGLNVTPICHKGYAALVDNDALVPRWVAYHLIGDHTLGCFERKNNFHADDGLPTAHRARPVDYAKSGYDIGHMAPAADFAWNESEMSDSFSLANMVPQIGELNRQGWERLEEMVRTWAWTRSDLEIYVGPVLKPGDATIGADHVEVPAAFWKVIVDRQTGEALAFEMKQEPVKKADALSKVVSIAQVERDAEISLPLPAAVDKGVMAVPWTGDLSAWNAAASKACGR